MYEFFGRRTKEDKTNASATGNLQQTIICHFLIYKKWDMTPPTFTQTHETFCVVPGPNCHCPNLSSLYLCFLLPRTNSHGLLVTLKKLLNISIYLLYKSKCILKVEKQNTNKYHTKASKVFGGSTVWPGDTSWEATSVWGARFPDETSLPPRKTTTKKFYAGQNMVLVFYKIHVNTAIRPLKKDNTGQHLQRFPLIFLLY